MRFIDSLKQFLKKMIITKGDKKYFNKNLVMSEKDKQIF